MIDCAAAFMSVFFSGGFCVCFSPRISFHIFISDHSDISISKDTANMLIRGDFMIDLPADIREIYQQVQPRGISESEFLLLVAEEWLECYQHRPCPVMSRGRVALKNNLREHISASGMTQKEIARSIGVNPSYLSEVVSGHYEPSIRIVLLLLAVLKVPPAKIRDVFYLVPAD